MPRAAALTMFENRLRKNERHLRRWRRNHEIDCYRLYAHDLPDFPYLIDVYGDHALVQEFATDTPAAVDLAGVSTVVCRVLGMERARLFARTRRRQKGRNQYQRLAGRQHVLLVHEGPCRYWVNLSDYLDSGLFLDHRPTRRMIRESAAGRRFLNLFAYTATASVAAALGGAVKTVSVDLSNTYLDWARKNFAANAMNANQNRLIRADCLEWLGSKEAGTSGPFDLIFLDPPTFSNSKAMQRQFDVQRDHVELIRGCARLLAPEGRLLFSTNFRRFKLDQDALNEFVWKDLTRATIDKDFEHYKPPHQCWRLRVR